MRFDEQEFHKLLIAKENSGLTWERFFLQVVINSRKGGKNKQ